MLHNLTLVRHKICFCDTFYIPAVNQAASFQPAFSSDIFCYHVTSCDATVEQYTSRLVEFLFPFSLEGVFVIGAFLPVNN